MTLRVGLITDNIDDGNAGLASYCRGLISGLAQFNDVALTLIHRRDNAYYAGRQQCVVPDISGGNGIAGRLVRKQLLMPWALRHAGFDLVHDTYHYPPFLPITSSKRVVTIHDLVPLILPETSARPVQYNLLYRTLVRALVGRADAVIADSEATRRDVIERYGTPPRKVSTVYLAAGESFRPIKDRTRLKGVRAKFGLPDRFILYVGTLEPRKNLVRLIGAYRKAIPLLDDVPLLLGGGFGWKYDEIVRAASDPCLGGRVRLLGRIPDEDLPALYSLATVFVFPSLYEGFGLPVLEAMACGCPVITSRTSSLPEVAGDAAVLVDPQNEDEIASALVDVVSHEDLRQDLSRLGVARATEFNWRRCAQETLEVYRGVVASGREFRTA